MAKALRTRVSDHKGGHTEVLTSGSSETDVVSVVVVNSTLGEHGVVLNLRLAERRAVVGDDDQLSCNGHDEITIDDQTEKKQHTGRVSSGCKHKGHETRRVCRTTRCLALIGTYRACR